ncbi:MAG: histidine kinase [Chloroflexota bacterium]
MDTILKSNIGRRILLLVTVTMLPVLIALAISGILAVQQSLQRVSNENQALAQAVSSHLDYILRQNQAHLEDIQFASGVNIADADPEPERKALHSAYLGSIFDTVFIADPQGRVLLAEPPRPAFEGSLIGSFATVRQVLDSKRSVISDVFRLGVQGESVVFIISPLRDQAGQIAGLVGGQVNVAGNTLRQLILPVSLGETGAIDVIDRNGVILASSDPLHLLQNEGRSRGEEVLTEIVRLPGASWSVAVSQSRAEALAPVRTLEFTFIIAGALATVIVFFLSWGMAASLVKPIGQLKRAAQNISRGNLLQPVPALGSDEIGDLGRSFDAMRVELKKSLEEIQEWNRQLEAKIEERTRQLHDSYREIAGKDAARGQLLQKILLVQEEERKRVARELHDETTQSLLGLVMKLEAAAAVPDDDPGKIKRMLPDIRSLAVNTLDNVHKLIFDLRPSVLDDLGLLSALRWYAQNRLGQTGTRARVEVGGEERDLPPQVEIALFRVAQEAMNNIARHAQAHNVLISLEFKKKAVSLEIEDDGRGFDTVILSQPAQENEGVGLMGMRERIELIGGSFRVEAQPGSGTHITVEVPLGEVSGDNAKG